MRLNFVFVGKTSLPEAEKGIKRYLGRLGRYARVGETVVKAEKITRNSNEDLIKTKETERILRLTDGPGVLVLWDQNGMQINSRSLARLLRTLENSSVSKVWMVVGGPLGVAPELAARADHVLALSRMTFPHDLARLLVAEQLYRAFTILRGEPYHK